jgi:DNA gyrase subunit A
VIELSKTAEPEKVLQDLYKSTPMRTTFGIIMLALVDGEPRMLSLKQALRVYLDHRLEVVRRRVEFDLAKARQRAHILEGLRIALKFLDEVIEMIRKAPDADTARDRLMKRFKLSEIQAQAILDMQLRRLAALERKKIEDEYKELQALIKDLEALLKSPARMRKLVADDLRLVKETYGDRRRTQLARLGVGVKTATMPVLTASALLPEQEVWVAATAEGLISRTHDEKPPRISGTAAPRHLVRVNSRDTLFLVSESGEAAGIPVHSLIETDTPSEGTPLHKASALADGETLAAIFSLPEKEKRAAGWYVLTCTRQGLVKKTAIEELPGPTGKSFTIVKVNEDDRLGWVRLTDGKAELLLATADGMAIRFSEDEVRPMGQVAAGVGGIKLGARDEVIGMELVPKKGEVMLVSSDGKAKRIEPAQFPVQGRYGQGVIAWKLPRSSQVVGMAAGKANFRVTLLLDKLAPKAIRLDEAPLQARSAAGKNLLELKAGYQVLGLSMPWIPPRPVEGGASQPEQDVFEDEDAAPKKIEGEQLTLGLEATPKSAKAAPKPAVETKRTRSKPTAGESSAAKPTRSASAKARAAKTTPAKTTPPKATPTKTTPSKSTPAKTTPAKTTPPKATPTKTTPAKTTQPKATPAKSTPTKPAPAKATPAKSTPTKPAPAKATPAKTSPTQKPAGGVKKPPASTAKPSRTTASKPKTTSASKTTPAQRKKKTAPPAAS